MNQQKSNFLILFADDDSDDHVLLRDAFRENESLVNIKSYSDGLQLITDLQTRISDPQKNQDFNPSLIILDLNMPVMDGKKTLTKLKTDSNLKHIPVIIFTTSENPDDIKETYLLGANSYFQKPSTYKETLQLVKLINDYWLGGTLLPT